ncbi:MAG: hypothetical protein LBT47_00710 [Deltaproteobacteria bacterium]|jgi:hypothetical protein|nr:hypothetical protein [Deltaproteobacteria bacterium]
MRWWVDFNVLSEKQKWALSNIRNQFQSSHWIQGFAGTGKSLVLLHLMEQMSIANPNSTVCFITYTNALTALVASTPLVEKAKNRFVIQTHTKFLGDRKKFDFVFLDEVQDIGVDDLTKIKNLSGKLYIAGDPDQKIYDNDLKANDIINLLNPQISELNEVFRLTPRLCKVAQSILPEARLVAGLYARTNANATIHLMHANSVDTECAWVWKEAIARARPGDPSVILFPHHDNIYDFAYCVSRFLAKLTPPRPRMLRNRRDYTLFNAHFKNQDVPLVYLGSGFGSLTDSDYKPIVYFMTYHSAKGLDFKSVFIPFLNDDAVIVRPANLLKNPGLDRRLLFVAVTRSRENLFISYSGSKCHYLLSNLPNDAVVKAEIGGTNLVSGNVDDNDEEEFF